jgi:hypothetical protein
MSGYAAFKRLIFKLLQFAYFGALLVAYLLLFKLLLESAYLLYLLETSGCGDSTAILCSGKWRS